MKWYRTYRYFIQGLEDYRGGIQILGIKYGGLFILSGSIANLILSPTWMLYLTIYYMQLHDLPFSSVFRATLIDNIIYGLTWLICDEFTIWLYPLRYSFILFYPILSHKGKSYGDAWSYILQRCLYFYAFGLPLILTYTYLPSLIFYSIYIMWESPACYPITKSNEKSDSLTVLRSTIKWETPPECTSFSRKMFIPKGGKQPAYSYGVPYCPIINPVDIEDIIERGVDYSIDKITTWGSNVYHNNIFVIH